MKKILVALMAVIAVVYLLNPTIGIFELIPDNIPLIGNLDEGAAAAIIYSAIEYFRGKESGMFGLNKK